MSTRIVEIVKESDIITTAGFAMSKPLFMSIEEASQTVSQLFHISYDVVKYIIETDLKNKKTSH